MRDAARIGAGAAVALAQAGVLRPLPPGTLRRVAATRRHLGDSLAALAGMSAARWPDRPAIIDDHGTLTFAQLHARTAALATGLADEFGAGPDRSVAVMCRNHRGFVEAMLAAGRLGADLLLLNTDFAGPQLADVLSRERPGVLILDEEFLPALGFAGPDAPPAVVAWHGDGEQSLPTVEAFASAPLTGRPPRPTRVGRLTILTSGTTGRPKGARRSVSGPAILGVVASVLHRLGARTGEPIAVAVPMFHGYGFALAILALLLGSPLILRRRFDAQETLALVDEHRIAVLAVVPVMLKRLLDAPESHDRSSLRMVLSGAAPLEPSLARRTLETWGDVLANGYGSSEVGIATMATPHDLRVDPSSVGRPVLGATVRIVDDAGRTLPAGETGRVFVGSGMVFSGYTGSDGAGRSDERLDGLVSTGDVGHLDLDGRLSIDGRADDMIVSGGENVYPQEVEDVLHEHEDIADVAVLGVPDGEFGQRLAAWVVPAEGGSLDGDDVRAFVRERLARYKVPRDVIFVEDLPRTATGKVRRRALPGRE